MLENWQWVTDQYDLRFLRDARKNRGLNIHDTSHAEGIAMMLVQHQCIETLFLGIAILVKEIVVVVGGLLTVKILIRHREEGFISEHLFLGNPAIRPFSEIANDHCRCSSIVLLA